MVSHLLWEQGIARSTRVTRTMKYCSRGNHDVARELFSLRAKSPDGLHTWCKPCVASYERERYHAGDRTRKEANKLISKVKAQNFIWDYLTAHPCVDCGCTDPAVLEFDHSDPADKKYDVSAMFNLSVDNIAHEIAKCEVRCANCHKRRTDKQFGNWRYLRALVTI